MDKLESYRTTRGTCAKQILFSVASDGTLSSCIFIGNKCLGGAQAITNFCIGMPIDQIIKKLKGIVCKDKSSCPDQLAAALEDYKHRQNSHISEKKR